MAKVSKRLVDRVLDLHLQGTGTREMLIGNPKWDCKVVVKIIHAYRRKPELIAKYDNSDREGPKTVNLTTPELIYIAAHGARGVGIEDTANLLCRGVDEIIRKKDGKYSSRLLDEALAYRYLIHSQHETAYSFHYKTLEDRIRNVGMAEIFHDYRTDEVKDGYPPRIRALAMYLKLRKDDAEGPTTSI